MLTAREVSERLKISLALVYREIRVRLRAHCFGRRTYRIAEADLRAYLDETNPGNPEVVKTPNDVTAGSIRPAQRRFRHVKINRSLA